MDALNDIRSDIDNIDSQFIRLLAQRQILVAKHDSSLYCFGRESEQRTIMVPIHPIKESCISLITLDKPV